MCKNVYFVYIWEFLNKRTTIELTFHGLLTIFLKKILRGSLKMIWSIKISFSRFFRKLEYFFSNLKWEVEIKIAKFYKYNDCQQIRAIRFQEEWQCKIVWSLKYLLRFYCAFCPSATFYTFVWLGQNTELGRRK